MRRVTLTHFKQLSDYQNISQFISFLYNNEESCNRYFGNFSESTSLEISDAIINVLNVENVKLIYDSDKLTNFIMYSSIPIKTVDINEPVKLADNKKFSYTMSYHIIYDDIRFEIVTLGNNPSEYKNILVQYIRYNGNEK